jgi:PH domain
MNSTFPTLLFSQHPTLTALIACSLPSLLSLHSNAFNAFTARSASTVHCLTPCLQFEQGKVRSDLEYLGYLHKLHVSGKVWKQRWFVLRHNILYKYHTHTDKYPFGMYDLRGAMVAVLEEDEVQDSTPANPFMVRAPGDSPIFFCAGRFPIEGRPSLYVLFVGRECCSAVVCVWERKRRRECVCVCVCVFLLYV